MSARLFAGPAGRERPLALGALLGEGAAGRVHAIAGDPALAAKLYHPDRDLKALEVKIDLMLANPPRLPVLAHDGHDYPQIAWPVDKLRDDKGRFAGFLMPAIDLSRSTSLVNLLQRSSRRAEKLPEYYGYRVLVARNLAAVFVELHQAGHLMIDMKPANLRFYPGPSWMAVVDIDGFSIAGPATVRSPADQVSDEYVAPEGFGRRVETLDEAQDRFALAVIIFQLLNNGLHPFAGAATRPGQPSDTQGRINAGLYPYGLTANPEAAPSALSLHESLPRDTRALFDRAFTRGGERPDAGAWRRNLDQLLEQIEPCAKKPAEHAHFGLGCGFCAREARAVRLREADAKRSQAAAGERRRRNEQRLADRARARRQAIAGLVPPGTAGRRRLSPRRASAGARVRRTPRGVVMRRVLLAAGGVVLMLAAAGPGSRALDTLVARPASSVDLTGARDEPVIAAARNAPRGMLGLPEREGTDPALAAARAAGGCGVTESGDVAPCDSFALASRQSQLTAMTNLARSTATDAERSYLDAVGERWRDERARCADDAMPALCRGAVLDAQIEYLRVWQKARERDARRDARVRALAGE